MKNNFSELTRVQIPAMVHLTKLGYEYISLKKIKQDEIKIDTSSNILVDIFKQQFQKLNPDFQDDPLKILDQISTSLNNDDLGKEFYNKLISYKNKLIDFENIENNTFHFTAELEYSHENQNFRPDITLFVNGLPLVFIEVKKPDNNYGMNAEYERINYRIKKSSFKRFFNITQLMIFSDNLDYSNIEFNSLNQGSFYATPSYNKVFFNRFREQEVNNDPNHFFTNFQYESKNDFYENQIISDMKAYGLENEEYYKTNSNILTSTNKILTSMCSKKRLLFIIKYGLVYVDTFVLKDNKHIKINEKNIIRYQQMFAIFALIETLNQNKKSGIIWHTQGSGKTALSYFMVNYLKDYYQNKGIITKFYFIVDRIDLLEQSSDEFAKRGLSVRKFLNKDQLTEDLSSFNSKRGSDGRNEINVVNIHKFDYKKEDFKKSNFYDTKLQRIFFIDEAHRGYDPKGSFLARLLLADPNSIKIALTGTPILKDERKSWKIFGDYIHTYYYDKSISDGYTLKILNERMETTYSISKKLIETFDSINSLVEKTSHTGKDIVSSKRFLEPIVKYAIIDLLTFRKEKEDNTLGGMIICSSSEQAKKINEIFQEMQDEVFETSEIKELNLKEKDKLNQELILSQYGDKEFRNEAIQKFKNNQNVDFLIVYQMLQTGFDAPRLKKLYLLKNTFDHNLLQTITRVNRPYRHHQYGYLVDFVDIRKNFEEANENYKEELRKFNEQDTEGIDSVDDVLLSYEELKRYYKQIKDFFFRFPDDNLEVFHKEMVLCDIDELKYFKQLLIKSKEILNIISTSNDLEIKKAAEELKKRKIQEYTKIINARIEKLKLDNQDGNAHNKEIFNKIMNYIEFDVSMVGQEELKVSDGGEKIKNTIRFIEEIYQKISYKDDHELIKIIDLIEKILKDGNIKNKDSTKSFEEIRLKLEEYQKNINKIFNEQENLSRQYEDKRYVVIHKKVKQTIENNTNSIISDNFLFDYLNAVKLKIQDVINNRSSDINKKDYFKRKIKSIVNTIDYNKNELPLDSSIKNIIVDIIFEEYYTNIEGD